MRTIIVFLLLVLSVNCSACDKTSNDSLYYNIGYVDGICVKDYKVVYLSLGRNPWEGDTNNEKIFNQIFQGKRTFLLPVWSFHTKERNTISQ